MLDKIDYGNVRIHLLRAGIIAFCVLSGAFYWTCMIKAVYEWRLTSSAHEICSNENLEVDSKFLRPVERKPIFFNIINTTHHFQ